MARIVTILMLLLPALVARADAPSTRPAPFELRDVDGAAQHPLDLGSARANVIIFIGIDCPISNAYAPEINRLCEKYQGKARFFLVHSDPDVSSEQAKQHAKDFGYTCPILMDRHDELARKLGATVTPEAAVVGPQGKLEYRGRIDDLYYALGKRRHEPTTHDLRDAIDAVIDGRPVSVPRTKAIGCAISD